MLIRSPLPFVQQFVDELKNALDQHQPGTRLSKLQCLWVSFCLTGTTGVTLLLTATYDDEVVRDDGSWRFRRRAVRSDTTTLG